MAVVSHFPLVDGRLSAGNAARRALVEQMAADLVNFEAWHDEREAIRSLFGRGYPMVDIVMCIDDARQAAAQTVVAKVMSAL